jgi:hypothetical protein
MGGKHEHVAKKIGLTPDQYFKRLRVAKLANRFPQAIQHLREGKTCLTHLALIGDKMTEGNERGTVGQSSCDGRTIKLS